jgi:hypothetical protein
MPSISSFLSSSGSFDQNDIAAMSRALDEVCSALNVHGDATAREVIATRIIELARRGERNPTRLRDRVLAEANGVTPSVPGGHDGQTARE